MSIEIVSYRLLSLYFTTASQDPLFYFLNLLLSNKYTRNITQEISGIKWNSGNIALTAEELAKIPNIVFTFEVRTYVRTYEFSIK